MSNRFHSKYHRQNHHTYTNSFNADAGHDPIASREQPFRGDFVLAGALSAYAPLSATAGFFYSNNTALCAFAGVKGLHVHSGGTSDNTGIYVFSSGIGLSALANTVGINVYAQQHGIDVYGTSNAIRSYSPGNGITSYGGTYAGMFTSPSRAVSASGGLFAYQGYSPNFGMFLYGGTYGATIQSPTRAISANGGVVGIEVFSPIRGINVTSNNEGIVVRAPTIALSSGGGGVNIFNNKVGIFKSPTDYPKAGGIVLDVNGNTYITGDITVTGDISASGVFSYFDTKVTITSSLRVLNIGTDAAATISQTGNYPIIACYDADVSTTIPSFIVDGAKKGWVALGAATPLAPLYIRKNRTQSDNEPQIVLTDNEEVPKNLSIGLETDVHQNPFIGTDSNHHLLFNTASSTKMILTSSGRLGIGVSYADILSSSELDVSGAITIRGEQLNLTHVQTQNLSGVYLHLPAIGESGFGDFALLRQIGGVGDSGGTKFGNYHLSLDLHNDENANPNLNQQFSIRNISSDGVTADTIKNRIRVDGLGNILVNMSDEEIGTIASPARLTINGAISSNNNLTIRGSTTINGGLQLPTGDVKITNATFNSTNALTPTVADTRYGILSSFYKNGNSQVTSNGATDWKSSDLYLGLGAGTYAIDAVMFCEVTTVNGLQHRVVFNGTPASIRLVDTYSRTDLIASASLTPFLSSTGTFQHLAFDTVNNRLSATNSSADYTYVLKGTVELSTAGRFGFDVSAFSLGSPNPQSITVLKGSYITATKIG